MTAAASGFRAIVATELRRITRDRTGMFFIVVLPFLIVLMVGNIIPTDPRLSVGVVDLDDSTTSRELLAALRDTPGLDVEVLSSRSDLERDIRLDRLTAGLVLPAGLGERAATGTAEITVIETPTSTAATTVQRVVGGVLAREGNRLAAVRVLESQLGVGQEEATATVDAAAADLDPVVVSRRSVGADDVAITSAFDYVAPGQLTLFMFINSLAVGAALVEMRTFGVARRMLASPTPLGTQLGAVLTSRMLFVLAQAGLIIGFGLLAFSVDWGDPLGAGAVVVSFGLVSVGAGILAGTLAAVPDQTTSVGVPLAIGMAMLGGCVWPSFLMPGWMQTLGMAIPHTWAMRAWTSMVFEGAGFRDVIDEVAVLLGFSAVLLAVSVRRLRHTLSA